MPRLTPIDPKVGELGDAIGDCPQHIAESALTGCGNHDVGKLAGIHGIQATRFREKMQRVIVDYEES
jgi:hypothetical protein